MTIDLKGYRVFIATPRGLEKERSAFRDVITEYNNSDAMLRGVTFLPIGWEATLGGVGRPQALINKDLRECDYFVLILWDRWGSPPSGEASDTYTSGTEEEYEVAMECYKDPQFNMRQLVVFFKAVESERQLSDPGGQLGKVLAFKEKLEKERNILFHTYDEVAAFENRLRAYLAEWVRDHERGIPPKMPQPDEPALTENSSDGTQAPTSEKISAAASEEKSVEDVVQSARNLAFEGRTTEAEALFARAVTGNDLYALYYYGDFLFRSGRLAQAATKYERVIELANDPRDIVWKARALNRLGNIFKTREELDKAERTYRQSLDIFQKLGDEEGLASVYSDLGDWYQVRSDLTQAEAMYQHSLRINEHLGRKEGMADVYSSLGNLYQVRGDLDQAEAMHHQSLDIKKQLGMNEGLADLYSNLGSLHQARGHLDEAEAMYRQSMEMFQQLKDAQNTADILSNLGALYQERDDLAQAETMFRQSLETFERIGDKQGMADVYVSLGNIHKARKEWDQAEDIYRQGLELFEQLDNKPGMADVYNNLGDVYKAHSDTDQAEIMYKKSLALLH
jgi:tetratricopeptide (TPR) repeat protein